MLIAGVFCLGTALMRLGQYEGYERGTVRARSAGGAHARPVSMQIARIGMSVAVLEGDSKENLALGAAHLTDTAKLGSRNGNAAIVGHRDLAFRGLGDLRPGDKILIHTSRDLIYQVENTRIVEATDTSVLADDGRGRLTLITCYPFHYFGSAPQRFVVGAVLQ